MGMTVKSLRSLTSSLRAGSDQSDSTVVMHAALLVT